GCLELLNRQLELVEQCGVEQEILRPDVRLILREKVAKLEVLGNVRVRVLLRHFDESGWIRIRRLRRLAALEGPVAEIVEADSPALLFAEGNQRDDAEVADLARGLIDLHREVVDTGMIRSGKG